jgi:hypothetical protein
MHKNSHITTRLIVFVFICIAALGLLAYHAHRSDTNLFMSHSRSSSSLGSSSSTPQVALVGPPSCSAWPNGQPVQQTQPAQQSSRVWKRYHSARLGFSIEYPSESFTPLDGRTHGDTYTVSFVNKDNTPQDVTQGIDSYIEVTVLPPSLFSPESQDSNPCDQITLAGLPATQGRGQNMAVFSLEYKSYLYTINIENNLATGRDQLSQSDFDHIQQSFQLR